MLTAPSLEEIFSHNEKHRGALCCILFAPIFSKNCKEEIVPRIPYLNHRSGLDIHFYCAGYGGYWHRDVVPDMEEICEVRYEDGISIPWAFSHKMFADFVNQLEVYTNRKWDYHGNAELIVLDSNVNFGECIAFNVEKMVADKAVDSTSELFESLIRYARTRGNSKSVFGFSDSKAPGLFADAIIGAISKGPRSLGKVWEIGRHYAVKNLAG